MVALTPLSVGGDAVPMSKTEEVNHGIAVCEDCEAIQPVEVHPDGDIRTMGNPTCECGGNRFSLLE